MKQTILRWSLALVALLCFSIRITSAQPLPTVGTHFTFGIPEGPDLAVSGGASTIYLTVLSAYNGCAILTSPSGYAQQFSFTAGMAKRVGIDYNLVQNTEQGQSNKGILLFTSQPASVYLHDWVEQGGDATQIFPDDALDTSFVVGGWGVANDPGEHNNASILIAAANDSTAITVTAPVQTMAGTPANTPVTITLNRGETYILKADINDQPASTSLWGTTVVASKPVAVFSSVTCAYVPLDVESCNEMLDEVVGKRWWGKHYFAMPLGQGDSTVRLLITGDHDFFVVANGSGSSSTNGRFSASFLRATEFTTTAPVLVQQITSGSGNPGNFTGDPSLVTIPSVDHYDSSLFWDIPNLGFANFAPIILQTADIPAAMFDGTPLLNLGTPTTIGTSAYSSLLLSINPGEHRLASPHGCFTMAVGFASADAFTYLPGTIADELPTDSTTHNLTLRVDSAVTCDTFRVAVAIEPALTALRNAITLDPTITFDPARTHFVRLIPGAALAGATYTIDSSIPGTLTIHLAGTPEIVGSDLFTLVFFGDLAGSTEVSASITQTTCAATAATFLTARAPFTIESGLQAMPRKFTLLASPDTTSTCDLTTIALRADARLTKADRFVPVRISFTYPSPADSLQAIALDSILRPRLTATQSNPGVEEFDLREDTAVATIDTLLIATVKAKDAGVMPIEARIDYVLCGDTITQILNFSHTVVPAIDSTTAHITVATSPVTWGNEASINIGLTGLPIDAAVHDFDLDVSYLHDMLLFLRAETISTLTDNWTVTGPTPITPTTDRFHFVSTGADLGTSGPLVHLIFRTYLTDSAMTPVSVTSSLPSHSDCALTYLPQRVTTIYAGKDLCNDSLTRSFMLGNAITVSSAVPIVGQGIDVQLQSHIAAIATLDLYNLLGQQLASKSIQLTSGTMTVRLPFTSRTTTTAILRVSSAGITRSIPILLNP